MAKNTEKILKDYDLRCKKIYNSTTVTKETPTEKEKRMKSLEKSYESWFEYYFPMYAKCKCAKFHKDFAKKIIENKVIKAMAEWYRSAAKSVHIDLGIALYLMYVKKEMKFMLLVGETDQKAKKLLSDVQAQLKNNRRLINDYGAKFQHGDWSEGNFATVDNVRFYSLGFLQSPRGAREEGDRPDYIVVDDVDNKRHVNNDKMMREAVDYITEEIWGCFDAADNATTRFIYANNNFHKNSITNRLKIYFQTQMK